MLGPRATEALVALSADVAPGATIINSDEPRLRQVLLSPGGNAIRFSPTGGSVSVRAIAKPTGEVAIVVADTGIGIAPDQIDAALSMFGQVDPGLDRKYDGVGLGLPLAKMITECLGGTLALDSAVGVGTSVTLRFPRAASGAAPIPKAAGRAGAA